MDSRALVVVFLRGGADGLHLVPPLGDVAYHDARPGLAIDEKIAIPLDTHFGLHPDLAELEPLYRARELTIVPACGSDDSTRSHFEAQDLMERGGRELGGGWLGRWLHERKRQRADRAEGAALSAVGLDKALPESLRGAPRATALGALGDGIGAGVAALRGPLAELYAADPMLSQSARSALEAIDTLAHLEQDVLGADYPDGEFGQGLGRIARLIQADVGLQAAALDLPGWDSHFVQASLLGPRMQQLARGLGAFAQDLGPLLNTTSVIVMSEFGRRLFENAAGGTDHGRAGTMFVLGGGTPGGVRGVWPGLEADALEGPGDVAVANDYRDILTAVLRRHGPFDAERVFPGAPAARCCEGVLESLNLESLNDASAF